MRPLGHGHDPEGSACTGCGSDAVDAEAGGFETMRSVGRRSAAAGVPCSAWLGLGRELASIPGTRRELHAPVCIQCYRLVMIHDFCHVRVIGHATELDRAMATRRRTVDLVTSTTGTPPTA